MFNKLGLALTFSPTGKSILLEAIRLKELFNSELYLIHVGEKNENNLFKMTSLINECGISSSEVILVWHDGNPANAIINSIKQNNIDLLIAGALEKEKTIKYYFGSVARKLMRTVPCSLLILTSSKNVKKENSKIAVSIDYNTESEKTLQMINKLALLEGSDKIIVLREIDLTGLSASVSSSNNINEIKSFKEKLINEELAKMDVFLTEINLKGIKIEKVCLSGKEGWEARKFLKENNVDLFVVNAPDRKLGIFDRLFQHDLEYIFMDIPCDLFIIKQEKR